MTAPIELARRFVGNFDALVHIGANDGAEIPAYLEYGVRRAVFVEPIPQVYEVLRGRCDEAGYVAIQALCTEKDGDQHEIHVASNRAQSSSVLAPTGHLTAHPGIAFQPPIPIEGISLETLVRRELGADKSLMLVIDVQGFELSVLRGAGSCMSSVKAAWIELSHVDLYSGNALFQEVVDYMNSMGMKLVILKMNTKMYGNGLFVRK